MLNKQEIKELLKNKHYTQIINIFRKDYTNMIFEFAKRNNINTDETEVEELIIIISENFPKLEGYMETLSNILTSPDMNISEHLNYIIDNYDKFKKVLT